MSAGHSVSLSPGLTETRDLSMFRRFIVAILSAFIASCGGGSSSPPISNGPPEVASLTIDQASTATYRDTLTVLTRRPVALSAALAGESPTLAQGTSFEWSLVARPSGSAAQIRERTETPATQFVPDLAGVYTAQVVVNQAGVRSQPRAIVLRAVPVQTEFIVDAVPEGDSMVVRVQAGTENAPNQHCFLFGAGRCRPLSVQGELDTVPLGEFTATEVARSDGAGSETVFVRTFDAQMLGSDWHGLRIIVTDEPPTRQEAFVGLHVGVAARVGVVASLVTTDTPPRLDMPASVRTGAG